MIFSNMEPWDDVKFVIKRIIEQRDYIRKLIKRKKNGLDSQMFTDYFESAYHQFDKFLARYHQLEEINKSKIYEPFNRV